MGSPKQVVKSTDLISFRLNLKRGVTNVSSDVGWHQRVSVGQ